MELTENGPPLPISLTSSAAAQIVDTSAYWRKTLKLREEPLRLTPSAPGTYLIEARGVAGFIRIDELTLEIAPKFLNSASCGPAWRAAMWRLLAYGHGIEALSDAQGHGSKEDGIADILADLFLTSLRGASARGYPLGYNQRKQSTPFLRGRLDPRKYQRLLPVTGKLHVIASYLTLDTPTNRLLKWAGHQLAASVEDPRRRQRLLAWSAELPDVPVRLKEGVSVPPPRRHHPYLVHAVEIAKLLQDDRLAGYQQGDLTLPGFLWDSENLFERAVRRLFGESCRPLGLAVSKERLKLASVTIGGEERVTHTTPDITVRKGSQALFHADAKYKVLKEHPGNEDFYQVLAAGRVSEIDAVSLIYPCHGSEFETKLYRPAGAGPPTRALVACIGLEAFSTRQGIRRLQEKLRSDLAAWLVTGP